MNLYLSLLFVLFLYGLFIVCVTCHLFCSGQEVFYRMRSYGAAIADVALLLIAADDGVSH